MSGGQRKQPCKGPEERQGMGHSEQDTVQKGCGGGYWPKGPAWPGYGRTAKMEI